VSTARPCCRPKLARVLPPRPPELGPAAAATGAPSPPLPCMPLAMECWSWLLLTPPSPLSRVDAAVPATASASSPGSSGSAPTAPELPPPALRPPPASSYLDVLAVGAEGGTPAPGLRALWTVVVHVPVALARRAELIGLSASAGGGAPAAPCPARPTTPLAPLSPGLVWPGCEDGAPAPMSDPLVPVLTGTQRRLSSNPLSVAATLPPLSTEPTGT
jgi:hypothetical protein